jgi:tetratricopeptide (TPR) repeat protein
MQAATVARQRGRFDEAFAYCEQIVDREPGFVPALLFQGALNLQQGRAENAVQIYADVLSRQPDCTEASAALGIVLYRLGRISEAFPHLELAAGRGWPDPVLLNCLGAGAFQLGKLDEAIAAFRRTLELDPNAVSVLCNLGHALDKKGDALAAKQCLLRAVKLAPQLPQPLAYLGNHYFESNEAHKAVEMFRKAVAMDPNSAMYLVQLSRALLKEGSTAEAETCLARAINIQPRFAAAYNALAVLQQQLGRFQEARENILRGASLEPDQPEFACKYVFGTHITTKDQGIVERLLTMSQSPTIRSEDASSVQFALGKATEDLCHYEDAMNHYFEANRLATERRANSGDTFDAQAHTRQVEDIISHYSAAMLSSSRRQTQLTEAPVFVIGMMRSGTSLVEQVLSCHPEFGGAGELPFWLQNGAALDQAFRSHRSDEQIGRLASEYLTTLERACPNKSRVCDKLPQNYMILGALHAAFPQARIIHCRRQPIDNCFSIYVTPFPNPPPFANNPQWIAHAYRQYLRLMGHWRSVLPRDRFMEVDYENLVEDRETTTKRMVEFLELEWNESCLAPEKNGRQVRTPSFWQVRQPVYSSSIGRWKRFAPWLGDLTDLWACGDEPR